MERSKQTVPGAAPERMPFSPSRTVSNFRRAGERGEDHLALGGDSGGGLGPGCAELDQVGGVLLDEVVDDDAVAAFDDVGAHWVADVAGADEADVHGGSLSWRIVRIASAPEPQGTRPRISAVAIAVVAVVGHGEVGREGLMGVIEQGEQVSDGIEPILQRGQ